MVKIKNYHEVISTFCFLVLRPYMMLSLLGTFEIRFTLFGQYFIGDIFHLFTFNFYFYFFIKEVGYLVIVNRET